MMMRKGALCAFTVLFLAGCAGDPHIPTRPLPAQEVGAKDNVTLLTQGDMDGSRFMLLTSLHPFEHEGKLAMCGTARVVSTKDVTPAIRESLALPWSTLSLALKPGDKPLIFDARFIPLSYQPAPDGKISFNIKDLTAQEGGCVVTDRPWTEAWTEKTWRGWISLFSKESRKRSQTVVGGAQ